MGCCDGMIKCLLFVFNVIFAVAGLAMIISGAVFMYQLSDFKNVTKDIQSGLLAPQVAMIVLGCVIFITSSLGCCGAVRGSRCKLITFAVILLLILVVKIGIAIYAAVNINDFKSLIETEMKKYFKKMFYEPYENQKLFHDMESYFHCCGVKNSYDYVYEGQTIPKSCCVDSKCTSDKYWPIGCAQALTDISTTSGKLMIGLGITLAILEAIGAGLALRLSCLLDKIY